jgi:hypothetical protein
MKRFCIIFAISTTHLFIHAQTDVKAITDSIVAEGKRLYRSEMASWYGTDIFTEKFKDQLSNTEGYLSYANKDMTTCIFFSKGDKPEVLATINFDSTYNVATAKTDATHRAFTKQENDLYVIRQTALHEINIDHELFKSYEKSNLNLIPIISNKEKKVYVLTGPSENGVIIIGNDYLLRFDDNNILLTKKQLHKNVLFINFGKDEKGNSSVGSMHTHLPETGDFITATDICTLMLYEKFAQWEQHLVASKNYVSIWDCKEDALVTLTTEAWDKIIKDQKKGDTEKKASGN